VADSSENPCVVSQEQLNLQCLQCGSMTIGNFITIAECPRCGALDYHIFRAYVPLDEASQHRRAVAPDNSDVINKIIDLVQRKSDSGGRS
jgi:predicted  nucleic acid-binding Zn-ribbon protein